MELRVIKSARQYNEYLSWVDEQFDKNVKPTSPAGRKLEVALALIKLYEDEHYAIPYPDPIEAIKSRMQEMGLRNKDLVGVIGSKSYISLVLNRHKPLTLDLAKAFHKVLGIPAEVLLK